MEPSDTVEKWQALVSGVKTLSASFSIGGCRLESLRLHAQTETSQSEYLVEHVTFK